MPPAPRPHVRAARATGLSFLRRLVSEPEVTLGRGCPTPVRACGFVAPPSPGHPKAKRPGCSRPRRTDGGLKHESYLSAVPCSSPSLSAAPVRRAQTRLYRTLAHATFRPRAEYGTRPDRITTAGEADYNGMKPIRENSKPISSDTGLLEIKRLAEENTFSTAAVFDISGGRSTY